MGCALSRGCGCLNEALADRIACLLNGLRRQVLHACAGLPTLWIAEGLVYYLEMGVCARLLQGMAALAAPGSALIMTHLSWAFYQASQKALQVVFNAPVPAMLSRHYDLPGTALPCPACWQGVSFQREENVQGAGSSGLKSGKGCQLRGHIKPQQRAAPGLDLRPKQLAGDWQPLAYRKSVKVFSEASATCRILLSA